MNFNSKTSEANHDRDKLPLLSERMIELFPRGMPSPLALRAIGLFVESTNGKIEDVSGQALHLAHTVLVQRESLEKKFEQTQVQPIRALIRNLFALVDLVQDANSIKSTSVNGNGHAVVTEKIKKKKGKGRTTEQTQHPACIKDILSNDVQALWERYQEQHDDDSRNKLIEIYRSIVKYHAVRIWNRLPEGVELDDLVSAGLFGLIDAIAAFDFDRGVKFETYCAPRIFGSILDELRKMDWVPRLVRSKAARLKKATDELINRLGRPPTIEELAEQMKMKILEVECLIAEADATKVMSLDKKRYETDSFKDVREVDILDDKKGHDPGEDMAHNDAIRALFRGLNKKERLIMISYYSLSMTMKEIGESLDLSESRVSQMHSAICERLASSAAMQANLGKATYKAIVFEESI